MSTLLFDIGGTTLRLATSGNGTVENVQKFKTPAHPLDAIALFLRYMNEEAPDIKAVYGGIAGVVEDGVIRSSPHLQTWESSPFQEMLRNALGVPVRVENDAALAALGEATYGAGKGHSLVGYIGVGTGIGGALVVGGEIAPNEGGFEPGHLILDVSEAATFEQLVSGSGLEKHIGKPAKDIERDVYDALTPLLAAGLYNVMLTWSPEVLVVGGSLMNEENGYRMDSVRQELNDIPTILPVLPRVKPAMLGDENGLYGALALSAK